MKYVYLFFLVIVQALGSWNLRLAVSTLTRIPGRLGNFEAFGTVGLAADENVLFLGHGSRDYFGVFSQSISASGVPVKLVDNHTPIPASKNTSSVDPRFEYFILGSSLSTVDSRLAVFSGGAFDAHLSGVYLRDLTPVADVSTPVPGKPSAQFYQFKSPSHTNDKADNSSVSFVGMFSTGAGRQEGAYIAKPNEQLQLLADFDTEMPGSGGKLFTMLTGTILENGYTVFFGSSFQSALCTGHLEFGEQQKNCSIQGKGSPWPGIYMHDGTQLWVLVDSTTIISTAPSVETFNGFSDPSFDGRVVSFVGATSEGRRGIFTYSLADKVLALVADVNTVIPGTSIPFGAFPQVPAIKDGVLVFYATVAGASRNTGVYEAIPSNTGYELKKIITKGDIVEGYTVEFLQSSWDGYNGNSVAVQTSVKKGTEQVDGIIVGTRTPE